MNLLLLLCNCLLVVAGNGWLERSRSYQQWPQNRAFEGQDPDNYYHQPGYYSRVQRGTPDDNSRFSLERVRSNLSATELNYWCHTYDVCHYEGGFTFFTSYENNAPEQLHYYLAMKRQIKIHHGEKFSMKRKESEAPARLEKKQKLQELTSILLGSWTNVLNQFLKLELPETHLSEVLLDYFSRIVEISRLDKTIERVEKVLRLFPTQFLTPAGKGLTNPTVAPPVENVDHNDFLVGNYNKRSYGYQAGPQGQFGNSRRLRRSTTREIKTSYVKEQTIANATFIMSEVLVYIFESHPKLFAEAVNFLNDKDIAYTDASLLAFKRILSDTYGGILKEKRIAHGAIVTQLRQDMLDNMIPLDIAIKGYWSEQMEFYTDIPTSGFAKKAEEDAKNFLGVYVWIQPFKQVENAYIKLEQIKDEAETGNNEIVKTRD